MKTMSMKQYLEIISDKKKLKIMMRKAEYHYQTIIFQITSNKISLCCQIFFHSWHNFRKDIPEYGYSMTLLTNNAGIILCPNCIIKKLKGEST